MQDNRVRECRLALFEMCPYRIAVFTKREVRIDNVVAVGVLGAGIVGGLVQEFVAVAERHPGRRFQTQVQAHHIANVFVVFTKFFLVVHLELGREELHIAEIAGLEFSIDRNLLCQKLTGKLVMLLETDCIARDIRSLDMAILRRESNRVRRIEKQVSAVILVLYSFLRTTFPLLGSFIPRTSLHGHDKDVVQCRRNREISIDEESYITTFRHTDKQVVVIMIQKQIPCHMDVVKSLPFRNIDIVGLIPERVRINYSAKIKPGSLYNGNIEVPVNSGNFFWITSSFRHRIATRPIASPTSRPKGIIISK